jgi:hypothetical protein
MRRWRACRRYRPRRSPPRPSLHPARPGRPPYRSFRGLLEHLATLTRNRVRFADAAVTVPMLAEPTSDQRQAFDLLGAAILLTLK